MTAAGLRNGRGLWTPCRSGQGPRQVNGCVDKSEISSMISGMETSSLPTCKVIAAPADFLGKQGLNYRGAISAESVGATGLCMHLVNIPPSARAKAHLHESHETAIYVLSGNVGMWYGKNLEHHLAVKPGDFLYIPAGMPHLPYNLSDELPAQGVLARTDPNEQESVVLLPELDKTRGASGA